LEFSMWRVTPSGRLDGLTVFKHPHGRYLPAGQLTFRGQEIFRPGAFTYAQSYLETDGASPNDPIGLALRQHRFPGSPEVPLACRDAGPEGWGRTVLSAAFEASVFVPFFPSSDEAWEWPVTPNRYTKGEAPIDRLRSKHVDEVAELQKACVIISKSACSAQWMNDGGKAAGEGKRGWPFPAIVTPPQAAGWNSRVRLNSTIRHLGCRLCP
jgi:hypothetical protein